MIFRGHANCAKDEFLGDLEASSRPMYGGFAEINK
jgi:hypothetical protein